MEPAHGLLLPTTWSRMCSVARVSCQSATRSASRPPAAVVLRRGRRRRRPSPTSPSGARTPGWAAAAGGTYTRYADDLAFSGPSTLARSADAFLRGVERIVVAEGHEVNRLKTRVSGSSARQTVTGVVVNARTNVARTDHDALRAILHNCRVHEPESQQRGQADLRAHLAGRISWVESLNPRRGRRLRDAFERISW